MRKVPITGSKSRTSMRRPFVPNAKDTSADEEQMISAPPTPFKNDMTTAQMPTGNQAPQKTGAVGASPSNAAVGQKRPINNSGQVYGPKGVSHPSRIGSFFPATFAAHKGSRDAGGNPRMAGAPSMRTTNPMAGISGSMPGRGPVNTAAAATKKPNRKGGSAFYGER